MSIHADRILFKDDWFLAVDKLAGELVVKGSGKVDRLPLLDFLRKDYPGLAPVQRLDFETSGIVLFARTKPALHAMMDAQKSDAATSDRWKKIYRTLVVGRLPKDWGDVAFPLPARSSEGTVPALTRYRVLERFGNSSYIEAEIETGRHHQIRRHFAAIRHPLVLDKLYGAGFEKFNRIFIQEFSYRRFFLHAFSLSFHHPFIGKEVFVEAPLPRTFEEILGRLRALS
jgi:23S rRNA pseudouridine955/2504/2580 synthase